jgi:hypothetical protein
MVGPSTPRLMPGRGGPCANASTCTPLGMITASPPRCSTCTRRAKSETAIRPLIRSSQGCTTGPHAASHFDRVVAAWKVATIGPLAIMHTSRDADGGAGSCTWTTSNWPSRSQRRTRAAETGPNWRLAIEPLYGTGTVRPAKVAYGGSESSRSAGVRTST